MQYITLENETDFDGWRKAARSLVLHQVKPADITWAVWGGEAELFAPPSPSPLPAGGDGTFNVPAKFVELAKAAILHRDPERFAILYRLLSRLKDNHDLIEVATDVDVAQVTAMAKAIYRDEHKMLPSCASAKSAGNAKHTTSPGSSRSIISSSSPRRSSPSALPTCPGRS